VRQVDDAVDQRRRRTLERHVLKLFLKGSRFDESALPVIYEYKYSFLR
jgi:hypothetical protein